MNLLVVVILSLAGLSFLVMVALIASSIRAKFQSSVVSGTGTASTGTTLPANGIGTWKAPSISDFDGIVNDTQASGRNGLQTEARRKKLNAPVTMHKRIIRAGIYRKGGIRRFHIVRGLLALSMLLGGCLVVPITRLPWEFAIGTGAFAAVAGYLLPSFWLDYRLAKRQTQMRRALPDALDLITVCLQGGLSLPASLARVANELGPAHPMLATELSIVQRETQMGRDTGGAMFEMAQRFNLEELRSLSSVISQTEKYGGTIASALKDYAESLRIQRRQRAEEMAQKAAVKLLFPTLLCIFPGIFVVVLGPTAIRMYEVMSGISWGG